MGVLQKNSFCECCYFCSKQRDPHPIEKLTTRNVKLEEFSNIRKTEGRNQAKKKEERKEGKKDRKEEKKERSEEEKTVGEKKMKKEKNRKKRTKERKKKHQITKACQQLQTGTSIFKIYIP